MRTKWCHFHVFPRALKQKNIELRPKMTKIASKGGGGGGSVVHYTLILMSLCFTQSNHSKGNLRARRSIETGLLKWLFSLFVHFALVGLSRQHHPKYLCSSSARHFAWGNQSFPVECDNQSMAQKGPNICFACGALRPGECFASGG